MHFSRSKYMVHILCLWTGVEELDGWGGGGTRLDVYGRTALLEIVL